MTHFASLCFLVCGFFPPLIWTLTVASERTVEMWLFETDPETELAQVK